LEQADQELLNYMRRERLENELKHNDLKLFIRSKGNQLDKPLKLVIYNSLISPL